MIDKEHCSSASAAIGETGDCTVRACAVATQIEYSAMHEWLEQCGRKPKKGMRPSEYHAALAALGVKLERLKGPRYEWRRSVNLWGEEKHTRRKVKGSGVDYDSATVTTLARELTEGTFLVGTHGHVLCLRDGVVEDWTEGRKFRVETVYRVIV